MAARKRAQDRDFNRRRWMILDKGIDMAYNQKATALGECLLKWNVREESMLQRRQRMLERQGDISVGFKEQEKKLFVVTRDQAIREPTLLLERTPSAEQFPGYVDLKQPRYMRPLNSHQSKAPQFATFSVFQAVKRRKRNPWEEAVKEDVQFRPTLCPCARLNEQDAEKLLTDWAIVNEKQTKALGLRTDNRSAPVKQVRTGLNPLSLPPRLNSQLHHAAHDLLGDISTLGSDYGSDDSEESGSDGVGAASVDRDDETAQQEQEQDRQTPVFVTQLSQPPPERKQSLRSETAPSRQQHKKPSPPQQPQQPPQQEFLVFEKRDNSQKERQLAHKRQVDSALVSIYDMLDRRRPMGRPRLRNQQQQQQQAAGAGRARITYYDHRHSSGGGTSTTTTTGASPSAPWSAATATTPRTSTSASGSVQRWQYHRQQPQERQQIRTTCRTAESIRILTESRRRRSRQRSSEEEQEQQP